MKHTCSSVRAYIFKLIFLRVYTLVFLRLCSLETEKRGRSVISRKIHLFPKMAKKSPKLTQNRVFLSFHKLLSLLFAESDLK